MALPPLLLVLLVELALLVELLLVVELVELELLLPPPVLPLLLEEAVPPPPVEDDEPDVPSLESHAPRTEPRDTTPRSICARRSMRPSIRAFRAR